MALYPNQSEICQRDQEDADREHEPVLSFQQRQTEGLRRGCAGELTEQPESQTEKGLRCGDIPYLRNNGPRIACAVEPKPSLRSRADTEELRYLSDGCAKIRILTSPPTHNAIILASEGNFFVIQLCPLCGTGAGKNRVCREAKYHHYGSVDISTTNAQSRIGQKGRFSEV